MSRSTIKPLLISRFVVLPAALLTAMLLASCQGVGSDTPATVPTVTEGGVENSAKASGWPKVGSPLAADPKREERINQIIAGMSVEEKVGQIMQAEIQSLQPGDVKKYHLGSVLNGGGSMPYRKALPATADWVKLADELYDESMDDSDGKIAIPVIWGTDAVHGHNNVIGATIFPHNIGLGAARNAELVRKIGEATAREVQATAIDWVFAPTLAVARNDAWGRTYESYAEDPSLVAEYSEAMVMGLQGEVGDSDFLRGEQVIATAKHFLADGGTWKGDDQGDARISEQELIEIHNAGYPPAIAAGVQTVMSSFSSWNGVKMHGNQALLTGALKDKMGFDGFVVGDWNGHGQVPGCTNDSCAQAINAGVDLVMVPFDWKAMIPNTIAQVNQGEISLERLDDAVRRILRVKMRAGLFDAKPSERAGAQNPDVIGSAEHRELARQAVRESLVLLKNTNKILPLNPLQTVLVAGEAANNIGQQSGGWSVTWQGTDTTNEQFPGATSIYKGIADAAEAAGGRALYSADGSYSEKPDVAIVVFGEQPYAEGIGDRDTVEFEPGDKKSLALLKKLRDEGIPVVSVFLSGRPMWVNPEYNQSNAFIAAWLPGTEGGGVADVLFAKTDGSVNYNFSGKLSFSWPNTPLDTEVNLHQSNYTPLFAFGYGLDYNAKLEGPRGLMEKVAGVATEKSGDIKLYVGRPLQPWNIFIHNHERQQILSGAFAALPDGDVKIETMDKDVQEDALRFTWKDAWTAKLTFGGGKPLNLSGHVAAGVLAFDLNVKDISRGGIGVTLECGENCKRNVPLAQAREWQGKGWQSVSLDMACFYREGDDFSAMTNPFVLENGGDGEIEIANIRFLVQGDAKTDCPDLKKVGVTPAKLAEYWSVSWWEPRHTAKLKRVAEGNVDLIMVGDSITQGWEEEAGAKVWQEYYGKRNAVNLGFSGDRTENVLWRLKNGEIDGISPKVAVVMIGTNNTGHRLHQPEYTAEGVRQIVELLKTKLENTKILLLAVFPREAQANAQMRLINEEINAKISTLADGNRVHFLNINAKFLADDGSLSQEIMPDLLHLNEQGYRIWADAMEPKLAELLAE